MLFIPQELKSKNEVGQGLVEYMLILALVAVVILVLIGVFSALGVKFDPIGLLTCTFNNTCATSTPIP